MTAELQTRLRSLSRQGLLGVDALTTIEQATTAQMQMRLRGSTRQWLPRQRCAYKAGSSPIAAINPDVIHDLSAASGILGEEEHPRASLYDAGVD